MIELEYNGFEFAIGRAFNQKTPENIEEYLETAIKTHDYLESLKIEDEDGSHWALPGNDTNDNSLFTGGSGVLFFYLELYKITGDKKYLEIINSGADYLNKNWRKTVDIVKASMTAYYSYDTVAEYSYYMGVTGIGEILLTIYNTTKREKELETITAITEFILNGVKNDDKGYHWGSDRSMLYDAGTMVFLYQISDIIADERILTTANLIADGIVSDAINDERGGYAWTSTAHIGASRIPNFECGTAGIGYALTIAYKYTKNEKYLNAAVESAKHLKAIAVKQGDGFLIPWHDEPNEETIFYVSSCHGPTGTSKLFYRLFEETGDKKYLDDIKGLYKGLRHLGVPERMSAGYWNTVCVCCGTAGILHFLINCCIVFECEDIAEDAAKVAKIAASILLGEQEKKIGGRFGVWPIAFTRVEPQNIVPEFGYSNGAAGVAATLLQMYLFSKNEFKWDRLIDDPYPSVFETTK